VNPHLSESELNALLWEEPSAGTSEHLAQCAECRRERELIAGSLAAFRSGVQQYALRDEFFWSAQRARIASTIAARAHQTVPTLAWSMLAGLIVLGIVLLRPAKPSAVRQTAYDQDYALLVVVEQTVNSEVPDALAPATLLAYEMNRTVKTRSK